MPGGQSRLHALPLWLTEQKLRELGHLSQSPSAAVGSARPGTDSARERGSAKVKAFLASLMKVVGALQRDALLNLWSSESSGGGQGSTRAHACRKGVGTGVVWLGLEAGYRCSSPEGFEKRMGPSRSCLFHLP